MSLPVCRVCLSSNIMTVHSVTDIQLRDIYRKLTGTLVNIEDNMPKTLCQYCYWQLQQCCKLTATALHSDKMLRKVLDCNTMNGLRYIHSLPKSRHLTRTTLKSISFNGESNKTICDYPRLMIMSDKNQPKPILTGVDIVREKPDIITTSLITKPSVGTGTKSLKKTPVIKQNGPISKQLSLQCILTRNPGLVITKQRKPEIIGNKKILKQESLEIKNEIKCEIELLNETQTMTPENQEFGTETLNSTVESENNLKEVKQTCKIDKFDENSQPQGSKQIEFETISETTALESKQSIFYFCNICERIFNTQENFTEHQNIHKLSENISIKKEPTLCVICNKYLINIDSHICEKIDNTQENLKQHQKTHKIIKAKRIIKPELCVICNKYLINMDSHICEKIANTQENLKQHQKTHKIIKAKRIIKPELCVICNKYLINMDSHICEKIANTQENLNQHQNNQKIIKAKRHIKPELCVICNKYVNCMASHKNVHVDKRYVCDICGHMSRTKHHLATHLRVHMDEPEIVCKICNKGFKHKSSYLYHTYIHTGERPYSCHICGGNYKQAGQLHAHVRFVHEGLKQFSCEICGKKYNKKGKLVVHLNTHANIKPFSCDKCQKVFITSCVLKRHVARYCKKNK